MVGGGKFAGDAGWQTTPWWVGVAHGLGVAQRVPITVPRGEVSGLGFEAVDDEASQDR